MLWRAGKDPKNPYGYAPRDLGLEDGAPSSAPVPTQPQAGPVASLNQPRGQKK
ncbi:hypothetical protein ACFQT0_24305 [Hymenobacter humi]|uniref:Uncharacterized protein n=1 Tax=Hymenobacter humi TaxID=1411620 RepID=A0ABW2U9E4_9BACT